MSMCRGERCLEVERVPLQEYGAINDVWNADFFSDSLTSGRRIACLAVTQDFRHHCTDIAVDDASAALRSRACSAQSRGCMDALRLLEPSGGRRPRVVPSWPRRRPTACATTPASRQARAEAKIETFNCLRR